LLIPVQQKNTLPLVSVIIPTFNRAHLLERAIKSVLGQTFTDFELIVVDDGSDDSTPDLLKKFQDQLTALRQKHAGVSAARNAGIRHSAGPLVAFLDSDDEWRPEKLSRQVPMYNEQAPFFICHTDEKWLRDGKEIRQKKIHAKQGGKFFERSLERCLISPSSVVIARAVLDRIGFFDENLPAAEDYDLWLRVTAYYEVVFVPERLVIKHGGSPDQLSETTPAIDRFRIQAILKILSDTELRSDYRRAAIRELVRKCGIVASGCKKKGKKQEAEHYLELARTYQSLHDESGQDRPD
jgi:glycosyltransferase involved in cell wall biosynthesis